MRVHAFVPNNNNIHNKCWQCAVHTQWWCTHNKWKPIGNACASNTLLSSAEAKPSYRVLVPVSPKNKHESHEKRKEWSECVYASTDFRQNNIYMLCGRALSCSSYSHRYVRARVCAHCATVIRISHSVPAKSLRTAPNQKFIINTQIEICASDNSRSGV